METKLHHVVPQTIADCLERLLDDLRQDLGFKQFDAETCPEIYQTLCIPYLFFLGNRLIIDKSPFSFSVDLIDNLQKAGLITPKPRNYEELKYTFENLFYETSRYLTEIKV